MEIRLDPSTVPFDLRYTLRCGQSFRWEKIGDWWYGVVREQVLKIKQDGDKLLFQSFPKTVNSNFVENYFRLDDDLPSILSQLDKDDHIRRTIRNFRGLRINRQEPWECLISYMCATCKNIPAIKNMVLNISKRFGEEIDFDSHHFYTFPKPRDLATTSLGEIRKCKLGFRGERILKVSRIIDKGDFDLEGLRKINYEEAKKELLSLPGVGQKVADCFLLFSLDKLEAFPVDVRIKRKILSFYSSHFEDSFLERVLAKSSITPNEYDIISSFGRKYFGEYAGYAQEYFYSKASCRK